MKLRTVLAALLVVFVASVSTALAADMFWDLDNNNPGAATGTTATGTWNTTTANWNLNSDGSGANIVWDPANVAVLSAGTDATGNSTITVSGTIATAGLRVEEGNAIFASSGVVNTADGPIVVNSGATLTTNTNSRFTTTAGSTLTLNGGTLVSTNSGNAGTFFDTDTEIIMGTGGGTLKETNTAAGILNIIQTATKITGSGSLTIDAGVNAFGLAGAATHTGGTFIVGGELRIRGASNRLPTAGAVTVTSPGILNLDTQDQTIGSLSGNGRVGLCDQLLTISSTTSTTFSGTIEDIANLPTVSLAATQVGGKVTKTGASTLTLTGANTYTGATTINTSGGAISIGDGGTSGSIVSNVNVNNANATLIFNRSDDIDYGGIVSGTGIVRKEGAGVLSMTNASNEWTNTGSITINGGAIRFGTSASGFATATPVVVNAAGTLDMNNVNDTFGSLAGSGAVLQGVANLTLGAASGTTTFSGTLTGTGLLRKGSDLPTGATHLSTQILSGNNSLGDVRVNAGTLVFSGASTAGATMVAGGSLLVNGSLAAAGTSVDGGLLGGTGNVTGAVTVNSGARLGAGVNGGNGTLTVDSLTLQGGSILRPTLGASGSPLGSSDIVRVTDPGAFVLNGSELEIATANGVADGSYRVLKYNGAYSGAISNLLNSTQAGFDSITIVDNTVAEAIDVIIDITERSWIADAPGNWSVGSNWGPNASQPNGPGAIANLGNTTPTNPAHIVTLDDGNKTVGVLNFTGSSNYTIAGGNTLILDTWGADAVVNVASGATHSITAPVEIHRTTNVAVTGASDTFAISGDVSGDGSFLKAGAGTLTLSGFNTYTGGNTVSAGTLSGNADSIKGAILDNSVVVFDQAADGTFASVISGTGSVTKNLAGKLSLTVANTFSGGFTLNEGTAAVDNNAALGLANSAAIIGNGTTLCTNAATARSLTYAWTVNGDFTLGQAAGGTGAVTMAGTMNLNGATRAITVDNTTDTISAVISNGGVTKNGAGTLLLTGANSYVGNTTINSGTVQISGTSTLGNNVIGTAGTLNFAGGNLNTSASRTASTAPVANPINMTADTLVSTTSTAATVDLNFSNDSIAGSAGTLTFRNNATAGTGQFEVRFTGAGFDFGRPIFMDSGLNDPLRTTRLNSFNTTGTLQKFSGEISGSGGYRRSASTAATGGTTEFTGNNSYSGGTTINDGTLKVNNTTGSGTGTGQVTVGAGTSGTPFRGTLAGTGSISGLITVQEGGTIAPGNSIGTLTAAGGLTLATNSTLNFDLGAPGAPYGSSDLIDVTSFDGFTINGGTVNLVNAGSLGAGTYKLIDYVGTLGGTFGNLVLGTQPLGFTYQIVDNASNTSIDLEVTSAGGVPGDYNNNGTVDAADYILWRKGVQPLQNEVAAPLGTTDAADYDAWRARFGNPGPGAGALDGNGAVPEASAVVMLLIGGAFSMLRRRGR